MRPSTAVARDFHADSSPPGAGGADRFAYRLRDFGIATECGFGRRPPATVPGLIELHSKLLAAGS